ncbi:MAG: thioredoxin family protein [Verrucomicrobia bacterium]|nr:thioredoxin family protein [Verrucomicrobiota bacterium]
MKTTKNLMEKFLLGAIACLALLRTNAGELTWQTDLPKALATAKAENKAVLLDFTGSDWCGFCIKLHKEVFSKDEFAEFAKKNLVLVEVDFPHKKKLPADQQKANDALQAKYKVNGFPTLVVLNADGKKLGEEVGYGGGGPTAVIGNLKKHLDKK